LEEVLKAIAEFWKESKTRSESSLFGCIIFSVIAFNYEGVLRVVLLFDADSRIALFKSLSQTPFRWEFWLFCLVYSGIWIYAIPYANLKLSDLRYNWFEKALNKKSLIDRIEEAKSRREYLNEESGNKTAEQLQSELNFAKIEDRRLKDWIAELNKQLSEMVPIERHSEVIKEMEEQNKQSNEKLSFAINILQTVDRNNFYGEIIEHALNNRKFATPSEMPKGLTITDVPQEELVNLKERNVIENLVASSAIFQSYKTDDVLDSIQRPLYTTLTNLYRFDTYTTERLVQELPSLTIKERIRHIERAIVSKGN